ncbi:MAG: PSD1 and planctomycete cytochrome C domain-containing protein [Planctomycetota bacterium]|nr:PSD1 and planctomycete cytochrome C domain-containing protein [Planctomycetota bacterium]
MPLMAPLLPALLLTAATYSEDPVDFTRDIRPLLADRCFPCHGPDAGAREAGLRLDLRASAVEERGGSRVIDTRDPAESELLVRVRDDIDPMPPGPEHPPLTEAEAALLERWIAGGAQYDQHWAYRPVAQHAAPSSEDAPRSSPRAGWAQGEIDRLVLDGLAEAGLRPAPRADARSLARRLSFDLLGLPPTRAQVEAFMEDPSQGHLEGLVDEFLTSAQHAERLTTFWFDLVRFADTTGIHADNRWNVTPYRDWVIEAFASNMPFDQFTVEQLAGDLLPDAGRSQRIAAAYNRLNLITREGGSQPKEFLARYTADRVRNVTEVWLASTVGCAECHDHKFDPFSTKEFYELGAFFADIDQVGVYLSGNNTFPPEFQVPSPQQERQLEELSAALGAVDEVLSASSPALTSDRASFEAGLAASRWRSPAQVEVSSEAGRTFERGPEGALRSSAEGDDRDTFTVRFPAPDEPIRAIRIELLPDPDLPNQGPGLASNGNMVLTELTVRVDGEVVPIVASRASFEQPGYPLTKAHDGALGRGGWAVMRNQDGAPSEAVFDLERTVGGTGAGRVEVTLAQVHGGRHLLGRWRLSVGDATDQPALAPRLRDLLRGAGDGLSEADRADLDLLHRAQTPLLARERGEKARLEEERAMVEAAIPLVMETRAVEPMVTRVLARGDWMDEAGEEVLPGVPSALGSLTSEGERLTRLDLARWLVNGDNPLVARVLVNRVWRLFMGRGIVETLDDFGVQGATPTHPELLDHLAERLVDSGWDLRCLIREIVTSSTYQQASSTADHEPERGRWFGQQVRHRLDAEFIRDAALAASGLLQLEVGGPSVRPYQPPGYWSHLNFPRRTYRPSEGADLYRRALYGHWQRQFVHPSLAAFDAPSRERCTSERPRSNTPLAALALLNDPIFVEAARALAQRTLLEAGLADGARLELLWQRVLQRAPEPAEAALLLDLLQQHREAYARAPDDAAALIAVGASAPDSSLAPTELAAWTSVARVALNLHEAIVRE